MLILEPAAPREVAIPVPIPQGSRVLIYKQDPSVLEIGIRKDFIPGVILAGPRDARITNGVSVPPQATDIPPVVPNVFGDFIQSIGSDSFDAVQTFAVVRMTLTMYQRALGGSPLPWQWNSATNTEPLKYYPHGMTQMNAFYLRSKKELRFGFFIRPNSSPS
jgi:hypothetical protein